MLIIALIGGGEQPRAVVADKIRKLSAHISIFDMRHPVEPAERLEVLNKTLNMRAPHRQTLLLLSVNSEQEAQLLRDKGAVFAVVDGSVPQSVRIRPGDLFVTAKPRASRHYLTAESMFSEARALYSKRRQA